MTLDQYNKWSKEIRDQQDQIISQQQYMRMCQVFIQDVWLDATHDTGFDIKNKATVMFELQGHFVK